MHARMPKNFVLEERIERFADAIEISPETYRGAWARACHPLVPGHGDQAFRRVHLDLGCGKGAFIVEMARRHPDTLFLGVDIEPVCIVYTAQKILGAGLPNAVAVPGSVERLGSIFAAGELDSVTLNFPTPHPKSKHASERLVAAGNLSRIRPLLAEGAELSFRTDSQPLFDYALPQFRAAGFELTRVERDDRAARPDMPVTEYESRMGGEGAGVLGLTAVPAGAAPTGESLAAARELPQSLVDYLPESLLDDRGAYVPHGMGYAVENLRHRRMRAQMRAPRA